MNLEGDQVRVGFKYERLVGLCYQYGKFGHEVKEGSSQGSTQQKERPYGERLKVGARRKESVSDWATYNPSMQQTALENATQTRFQTTTHVETADVNGIKIINDTWSLQTDPHESHGAVLQTTQQLIIAAIMTEYLNGAQIPETDHINAYNYGKSEIMGMEFNGSGVIASNTLDPSLINVPVKYDEQKARDPHTQLT